MNIIFMGTPEFAIPSLKKIIESNHKVLAVVTAPDKPRGRGGKVSYTPIKEEALKLNLPVLQPEKLKDNYFIDQIKQFNADLFVVVAFRILPKEVFSIPAKGSFNLHSSLLPKYRGAAPMQWAIINGEKETGVTTFLLEEKVDTGNILLQEKIAINDEDDLGVVHDKLAEIGADLVLKTIDLIEKGNYDLAEQDSSLASPAPKITKELCELNFNEDVEKVHNLIRGLSPVPGASFSYNGKNYKVFKTQINRTKILTVGEVQITEDSFLIGCLNGSLEVLEIQQEGKKRLDIKSFLRGFRK